MQNLYFIHRLNLRPRHVCIAIIHYLQRMKIVKFQMYCKSLANLLISEELRKVLRKGKARFRT